MASTRIELSDSAYTLLSSGDNVIQNQSNSVICIVHAVSLPSSGSVDFFKLKALKGFVTLNGLPSGNTYGKSEEGTTFVTVGV